MRQTVYLFLALGLSVFLSACGGGGGGGASDAPAEPTQLGYTGTTSQATIDAGNAETLALGAYYGTVYVPSVSQMATNATVESDSTLSVRSITRLLGNTLRYQVSSTKEPMVKQSAIYESNESSPGSCGGQLISTMTGNSSTGDISGSLEFQDFCEEGVVMDGTVSMVGSYDPINRLINSFSMTFHPLSFHYETTAYTMDGQIRISFGDAETEIMNILLRDDTTGEVFRFENYTIASNHDYDYSRESVSRQETVSGRYYHPSYGYIDLTTDPPLQVSPDGSWPFAGTLYCIGRNGTFVRMVFGEPTTYMEADIDGNGNCEWQKEIGHSLP